MRWKLKLERQSDANEVIPGDTAFSPYKSRRGWLILLGLVLIVGSGAGWHFAAPWRAIYQVKNTKISPMRMGFAWLIKNRINLQDQSVSFTYADYANMMAEEQPTEDFEWRAEPAGEDRPDEWTVSFVHDGGSDDGWGIYWLANLKTGTVRSISGSALLKDELGFSRVDVNAPFEVEIYDHAIYEKRRWDSATIQVAAFGRIRNDTSKTLHEGKVTASAVIVFDSPKAVDDQASEPLSPRITNSNPWRPGQWRDFSIQVGSFDGALADYTPRSASLSVGVDVADPVGFGYDKHITELELNWNWLSGIETTGFLRVRKTTRLQVTPGKRKTTRVKAGDVLTVTGRKQRYYRVKIRVGKPGWIHYKKVRRVPEGTLVVDSAAEPKAE